jgi:hypothetical protein
VRPIVLSKACNIYICPNDTVSNKLTRSGRNISHAKNDWQNNLFFPDGPAMFCYGTCNPLTSACSNCTDFATFEKDHLKPTHSLLVDPKVNDAAAPPMGMRPAVGSPLLGHGVPVGLDVDWVRVQ